MCAWFSCILWIIKKYNFIYRKLWKGRRHILQSLSLFDVVTKQKGKIVTYIKSLLIWSVYSKPDKFPVYDMEKPQKFPHNEMETGIFTVSIP